MEYTNKQFLLAKRPEGMPEDDCWKLNENKITSLKKNEILIEKLLNLMPLYWATTNQTFSSSNLCNKYELYLKIKKSVVTLPSAN